MNKIVVYLELVNQKELGIHGGLLYKIRLNFLI